MSEWQLIETAPKDGTRVLIYPSIIPHAAVGIYDAEWAGWFTTPGFYRCDPTHWMPLPAPPVTP